jgi:hypothetical protein
MGIFFGIFVAFQIACGVQKEALKNLSLLGHMGYLGLGGLHMSRLMITFAL